MTKRFITAPFTPHSEPNPLSTAIAAAAKYASDHGSDVLVVVNGYVILENAGWVLSSLLGPAAYKALLKNRTVGSKPSIRAVSIQDLKSMFTWSGPVILVFPNEKMFEAVDQLRDVPVEVVVPNKAGDAAVYEAAWRPTPLGAVPSSPAVSVLEPVVIAALSSLNSLVNTNNGMYGREKEDTLRTFSILIQHGHRPDTLAVVSTLTGKYGWPPKMAGEAGDLLDGLKAGKKYRSLSEPWPEAYGHWQNEAKKNAPA